MPMAAACRKSSIRATSRSYRAASVSTNRKHCSRHKASGRCRCFTGPGSDFLADVRVRIVDAHDGDVLTATSRGPYMLVKLRPGRYTVHAQYKDSDQTRPVTIPAKGTAKAAFYWNTQ
jgi:hypothetical protein